MSAEPYKVGDQCYFIDINNKIKFCEVKQVYEKEPGLTYLVQDFTDYRFAAVEHKNCADSEQELKERKYQ